MPKVSHTIWTNAFRLTPSSVSITRQRSARSLLSGFPATVRRPWKSSRLLPLTNSAFRAATHFEQVCTRFTCEEEHFPLLRKGLGRHPSFRRFLIGPA